MCLKVHLKLHFKGESRSHYRLCVPPCKRCWGYTRSVCGLLGSKSSSVGSRGRIFHEGTFASVPRGAGPAAAEAERRLHSWGSQMDLAEGREMGESLSSSSPARSSGRSLGSEARSAVSSPRGGGSTLRVAGRSSLQRALLSVTSTWKRSGAERLATPLGVSRAAGSAVSCRSSASGH